MDFQFAIDEGHWVSKDHFNTRFIKYFDEIPVIWKYNFNKHMILILSATITYEVSADLENQFNLSDALLVL